jgi:hypothetical protein
MQTTAASPLQQSQVPSSLPTRTITEPQQQFEKRNEQTLDYVVRSGMAGGVAGCLVREEQLFPLSCL